MDSKGRKTPGEGSPGSEKVRERLIKALHKVGAAIVVTVGNDIIDQYLERIGAVSNEYVRKAFVADVGRDISAQVARIMDRRLLDMRVRVDLGEDIPSKKKSMGFLEGM